MSVLYIRDKNTGVFTGIRTIKGNSGVYMGSDEPIDPDVKVWIEPGGKINKETYELIEEFTLPNDGYLWRTAEPDGKEYNFKKILVLLETTGDPVGFNLQVYRSVNDAALLTQYWFDAQAAGGQTLRTYVKVEIDNECVHSEFPVKWSTSPYAVDAKTFGCYAGEDVAIKRIGSSNVLPAGTIIRILGVRK